MSAPAAVQPKTRVRGFAPAVACLRPGFRPSSAADSYLAKRRGTTGKRQAAPYYLRARYYDPGTGQFINRDPMVATTRQPYGYTGDNPLNGTDPTGLWGWNDLTNAVGGFVRNNASTIRTIGQVASVGAGVMSIGALGCAAVLAPTVVGEGVCAGMEVSALALGGVALAADSSLAAFDGGSWGDAALDALTLAPGMGYFAAEAKAARYGTMFGRTLRAGCDASGYRSLMMQYRGAAGVAQDIEGMGAMADITHGGTGLMRRFTDWP